jgi:predicted nucleic acid-binding protein
MRIAIDTNILAYAEGVGDVARRDSALDLLKRLPPEIIIIPVQVLGELFRVLTGKASCFLDMACSRIL